MDDATKPRTTLTFEGDVQVAFPNAIVVPYTPETAEPKIAYGLEEAAELTSISLRKLRDYITTGQLKTRRNGRDHLVTRLDLIAFIDNLPTSYEEAS